jgi:DNA-binding transcriptional MocR family regulator
MVALNAPYDFARGHPNPALLPVEEMKELLLSVVEGADIAEGDDDESDFSSLCLNYGNEAGAPMMLKELQSFLYRRTKDDDIGRAYMSDEKHDQGGEDNNGVALNKFFITHGVSHSIELICSALTTSGDVVFVERPTYFLVADIFRSHGLEVRGLPMVDPRSNNGAGGIDINTLVNMTENGKIEPPKIIYLVPTHQNPTGHTMSVHDRRNLVDYAQRHGVLLVADEVYHLLDWRDEHLHGSRPGRMAQFNKATNAGSKEKLGCALSVSSFTKIFAPGVRCGWIEGPEIIIRAITNYGYIQSQGGLAPFVGDLLMCRALKKKMVDRFLDRLRKSYSERANQLCDILQEDHRISLPNGYPSGGYFLWVKLGSVDAKEFLSCCLNGAAAHLGVRFRPGSMCDAFADDVQGQAQISNDAMSGVSATSFKSYARLCFADLDEGMLEEGARRFIQAFRIYIDSS